MNSRAYGAEASAYPVKKGQISRLEWDGVNAPLHNHDRRHFLTSAGMLVSGCAFAAEPFARSGGTHLSYAIPSYSFRKSFNWFKDKAQKPKGKALDTFSFIDTCRSLGVSAELTAYFFPPDADAAYFRKVKRYAHVSGVPIIGTAIGNNFSLPVGDALDKQVADAIAWIDKAALLGAPHIRFFPGRQREFDQGPDRIDNAIKALQTCADHAAKHGIFVGVENHGGISADLLLHIVKSVDSKWIGINLDSGNFWSDTPYADLAKCIDYAVNLQVKVMMQTPAREKYPADFDKLASVIKNGNYQGAVVLEYEEHDPFSEIPLYLTKLKKALA